MRGHYRNSYQCQNSKEFLVLSTALNEGPQVGLEERSQKQRPSPAAWGQPARQGRRAGAGRGLLPLFFYIFKFTGKRQGFFIVKLR